MDVDVDKKMPKGFLWKRASKHVVDLIKTDVNSNIDRNVILSPSYGRSSTSSNWDLQVHHIEILWHGHG